MRRAEKSREKGNCGMDILHKKRIYFLIKIKHINIKVKGPHDILNERSDHIK